MEQVREAVRGLVGRDQRRRSRGAGPRAVPDDGDFTRELVRACPALLSAAAQAVKAFAESMEGMPPEEGAELVGFLL